MSPKIFLLAITPVLLFLVFWNLGNQYFWYDESQTAVLARSVLAYGYPRAFIGDFAVSTDETYGVGQSYIAQPWLQNYICAASFLIFGESTWSGRILFAVLGFLSFYLLYYLMLKLFGGRWLAGLAVIIGMTNVPYLLHLRQCRYYSLDIFFTLSVLISYLGILEKKRYSSIFFVISSFFLFHANFGCFVPILGALALNFFIFERKKIPIYKFIKIYFWVFILVLPWIFIYKIWEQGQGAGGMPEGILRNAKFYLSKINSYFFPYRFIAFVLLAIFIIKRRFTIRLGAKSRAIYFIGIIIAVNWVFLWFADYTSARYIVHIAGLFFALSALLLIWVIRRKAVLGIILLLGLCLTDLFNGSLFYAIAKPVSPLVMSSISAARGKGVMGDGIYNKIKKEINKLKDKAKVNFYFFDYIYEITHDYDGPMEGVCKYLNAKALSGDTIKTHSFNANSLFFYTNLKVDYDFSKRTYPEWIFLRDYWTEDEFYKTEYFREIEKRYEKIELPYPDIRYENRPDDMSFHHFRTATQDKRIAIYRRKD